MKNIHIVFLCFLSSIGFPSFSMDRLLRDLDGLKKQLTSLHEEFRSTLPTPKPTLTLTPTSKPAKRTWALNIETAPDVIQAMIQEINSWLPKGGSLEQLPKKIDSVFKDKEAQVSSIIIPANIETIGEFKELLKQILETYYKARDEGKFHWCECVQEGKRITLIIAILKDLEEKRPDKNDLLVYTSLAAGELMQDYLLVLELIRAGYKDIQVNIIDVGYPDVPILGKEFLYRPSVLGSLETIKKNREIIERFTTEVENYAKENSAQMNIAIYNEGYTHLNYLSKSSNIFLMVDPGGALLRIAPFPSEANVFAISIQDRGSPQFYLFVPRHQGVQLYEKVLYADDKAVQSLKQELFEIINKTSAKDSYDAEFITKLHDEFLTKRISFREKKLREIVEKAIEKLTDKNSTPQEIRESEGKIKKAEKAWNEIDYHPIGYFSDPHVFFQDFAWEASAENSIIYTLAQQDPLYFKTVPQPDTSKIVKIDVDAYKKQDVITPNVGTWLGGVWKGRPQVLGGSIEYKKVSL